MRWLTLVYEVYTGYFGYLGYPLLSCLIPVLSCLQQYVGRGSWLTQTMYVACFLSRDKNYTDGTWKIAYTEVI